MKPDEPPALQVLFVDADPSDADPSTVGALARAAVIHLRSSGEDLAPTYTGHKGATELFLWVLTASSVIHGLMALPDFALKVAQLLNEIKKLRALEAAPTTPPVTIVVRVEDARVTVSTDDQLSVEALLDRLLQSEFPQQFAPKQAAIEVSVPSTPPNNL